MGKCVIRRFGDHDEHHRGNERSSCFYFSPHPLSSIVGTAPLFGRFARIEVSDTEADLHTHAGATFVIITSGCGVFLDEEGVRHPVCAGDTVYVPPGTLHLSIAAPDTTMTEWLVYIGELADRQASGS